MTATIDVVTAVLVIDDETTTTIHGTETGIESETGADLGKGPGLEKGETEIVQQTGIGTETGTGTAETVPEIARGIEIGMGGEIGIGTVIITRTRHEMHGSPMIKTGWIASKRYEQAPPFSVFEAKIQSPAAAPITEEEKIRQRQERLEAWKRKQAEKEEAKKNAATPAALFSALDRPAAVETAPRATAASTQSKSPLDIPPTSATSAPISSAARPKADNVVTAATSPAIGEFRSYSTLTNVQL